MLISCLTPVMTVPVMPMLSERSYVNLHASDELRWRAEEMGVPLERLMKAMLAVGSDMERIAEWLLLSPVY